MDVCKTCLCSKPNVAAILSGVYSTANLSEVRGLWQFYTVSVIRREKGYMVKYG